MVLFAVLPPVKQSYNILLVLKSHVLGATILSSPFYAYVIFVDDFNVFHSIHFKIPS